MTRRSFSFTRGTLPLLNEPVVNPDGTMAESLRLFLEGVQQRLGGAGRDAVFEIDGDVADAVSDGVLTPSEKLTVIPLISNIQADEADLVAAASKIGLSTTAYEAAQDAFAALLATLTTPVMWNSRTGNTTIPDPAEFTAKWQEVLDEAGELRSIIDSGVADAILDGVLTKPEKRDVVPQIQALLDERTDLVASANVVGVSTTAYTTAHDSLTTYLATLTSPVAWDDRSGTTIIAVPQTFVDRWQALVSARDDLRSALTTNISDAVVDGVLTIAEKRIIVPQIKALQTEETELVNSAANRNVSSTAYEGKQDDLATYLATLTSPVAWDNFTGRTTIAAPSTFNTRVQDVIEARDALRSLIEAAEIRNTNLAARAATSTNFSASVDFGPYSMDRFADTVFSQFDGGTGTGDSPGRELLAVEVTITDANPGDPLLIWFDGQLEFKGGVAQYVCFHEKCWIMQASATFKNDFFGATAPRSTSDDDYLTVNDTGRKMTRLFNRVREEPVSENSGAGNLSTEANNSNQILSIPLTGMTVTAAPSDINTVPYKIVFAFVVDREQVSYQSGANNGWKNASSSASDWSIEDLDVVVMNLKERQ